MHGRVHPQILTTSSHRRSLFRDRFPPHAVHGAPRVSAKATSQPVCPKVRLTVYGVHFKLQLFIFIVALCWNLRYSVFVSGCTVSKFTRWLISSNYRPHQLSRAQWRRFANFDDSSGLSYDCLRVWSYGLHAAGVHECLDSDPGAPLLINTVDFKQCKHYVIQVQALSLVIRWENKNFDIKCKEKKLLFIISFRLGSHRWQ